MVETNPTHGEANADALVAMEKHRVNEDLSDFQADGESVILPLQSDGRREHILFNLSRGRINLRKVKMQSRGRHVVVLVLLDLGGAPHRNPDGEEILVPPLRRGGCGFMLRKTENPATLGTHGYRPRNLSTQVRRHHLDVWSDITYTAHLGVAKHLCSNVFCTLELRNTHPSPSYRTNSD